MSAHSRELEVASLAAREAGAVILRHYARGTIAVDTKADASPVTAADRDANAVILARLGAAFPDDGLLSEELPDDGHRLTKRRVWIVDPLDGTRDFVARTDEFCVHVALAIDGVATVGVVFQPVSGALFTGATGAGAFVEVSEGGRRPLRVSAVADRSALRMGVSRTNATDWLKRCLAETGLSQRATVMGASTKLMAIARGDLEAVINFSFTEGEWDTCAPEAVLREAGGTLTDVDGSAFVYNQPTAIHRAGSIASNGACHAGVVDLARPYIPPPSARTSA